MIAEVNTHSTDDTSFLERVEARAEGSTGALVFGEEGKILVEQGRIGWAAARSQKRKLGGILRSLCDGRVEAEAFERAFRLCLEKASSLREGLVENGLIDAETLRTGLQMHIAEGIRALSRLDLADAIWVPHTFQEYDVRFTFRPIEILSAMGGQLFPDLAHAAEDDLAWYLEGGGSGFAFIRSEAQARPVSIASLRGETFRIHEVLELGNWAIGALDMTRALSDGGGLASISWRPGRSLAAWEAGPTTFVATCGDPSGLAFLLSRHVRRRRGA
ncbi:hypothetical protein [Vulgatibacter incomptus]|uniref:Uncharacterized protein n=1 Tax=Vulgatibacter incomptus TaxID=1391653 RepID=A0A0K1P998_9BACT|nr:hypothetical protein [Vulgatibacter incomptus]AKU90095.1 hypothetical protein AKJ08_0482 [Vulgatibacter incomptus]